MFKILAVDDSDFDRRLVTSILETARYDVVSVSGGEQALQKLAEEEFDLLVTDLNMPDLDGLALIQKVQKLHTDLPTIIVTAYGSEATAMRALQAGAYSYVPKYHLSDELVTTVAAVLKTTDRQRQEDELLCSVAKHAITLTLPNDRSRIAPTIDYLQKLMDAMGNFGGSHAMHLQVALDEALSNAIIHGNLEVSSTLRERDDTSYDDLIAERAQTQPYSDRRVTVDVSLDSEAAVFVIRDEGPGFDISSLPDPHDPENLLRSSGRGITLMHAFLDDVSYNDCGNEVTLRMNVASDPVESECNSRGVVAAG